MKLYSYYRSTAAYRVRIALNYKNINYEIIPVNLVKNEHKIQAFINTNPQARVPVLVDGDFQVGQSLAIIDYLEMKYPGPNIYPAAPEDRAWVNYLAQIVCCDMHPLNNLGVLRYLEDPLGHDSQQRKQWYHHWLEQGFDALEKAIKDSDKNGKCCLNDTVTVADLCLIPQIYNAIRFEFSMESYPTLMAINDYCLTLDCFLQAAPEKQPDYVKTK